MNFTPYSQLTGTIPNASVHQFTTAKFAQNITATANATQMGQVVGVLSGGEGGVHYLRPVEGGAGFQALPHQQQQLITLPITMPGAKPGDPQQTVQIQVMSPAILGQSNQSGLQQPKYQMAQIPIQTFQQGELGTTVLTVAYAQQDGAEGMQIIGNGGLPEGLQVVAALQPHEMQMLAAQMSSAAAAGDQHSRKEAHQSQDESPAPQMAFLSPQGFINVSQEEAKKAAANLHNNNNNVTIGGHTFRIKEESSNTEETNNTEEGEVTVEQTTTAWPPQLAEYLSHMPVSNQLPVSLHQFLRFNSESNSMKRESSTQGGGVVTVEIEQTKEDSQTGTGTENLEDSPMKTKKKKKYKKKPPKPKKPKPGQVVIATSIDGTTLYCCPECHMAYPDKEVLEQHLVGHKIERRYICGICGAGLKRREHLERHKLGHNPDRPFVCSVCLKGFKRKEHLTLHFVIHSGEKTEVCNECGKGFYRRDHLRKHARSHASRRAREEAAAAQHHNILDGGGGDGGSGTPGSTTQVNITNSSSSVQPDITIHVNVPTSNSKTVPVQISVPQHIMALANSGNNLGATFTIKPEVEEMLLQQFNRSCSDAQQS